MRKWVRLWENTLTTIYNSILPYGRDDVWKEYKIKVFYFFWYCLVLEEVLSHFLFIKLYTNANIKDGWILKPTIRQKSCIKRKSILTCKVKRVKARIRNIYNLSNYLLYLLPVSYTHLTLPTKRIV